MLYTIDGETFYSFTKNTRNSDSGTSCYITNDDISLCDMTNINKLVQGKWDNISSRKKGQTPCKGMSS